jgi:hypothetical protein
MVVVCGVISFGRRREERLKSVAFGYGVVLILDFFFFVGQN